jgi:hypothetical protein
MWEPRRLTTLRACKTCNRDSFTCNCIYDMWFLSPLSCRDGMWQLYQCSLAHCVLVWASLYVRATSVKGRTWTVTYIDWSLWQIRMNIATQHFRYASITTCFSVLKHTPLKDRAAVFVPMWLSIRDCLVFLLLSISRICIEQIHKIHPLHFTITMFLKG